MYVITGITGQVGGVVARNLLAQQLNVRAVVRDVQKGRAWAAQGCEVALADMNDARALTRAFADAEAVFVLLPPVFDPSPDMAEARATIDALYQALHASRPQRVVCLSTIGAQASQPNLLNALGLMEQRLGELPMPVTFLRAAWFMENFLWDVANARDAGVLYSHLQPLDRPVPMIATADIGALATDLLQQTVTANRVVELEGPEHCSPNHAAFAFSRLLGRTVQAQTVPRETWEGAFLAQGMNNPLPRMQMLDGFNEGWICFEGQPLKGTTSLETVLQELLTRA
jgi:NAD(P)H dehydrogenase (quinone)